MRVQRRKSAGSSWEQQARQPAFAKLNQFLERASRGGRPGMPSVRLTPHQIEKLRKQFGHREKKALDTTLQSTEE